MPFVNGTEKKAVISRTVREVVADDVAQSARGGGDTIAVHANWQQPSHVQSKVAGCCLDPRAKGRHIFRPCRCDVQGKSFDHVRENLMWQQKRPQPQRGFPPGTAHWNFCHVEFSHLAVFENCAELVSSEVSRPLPSTTGSSKSFHSWDTMFVSQ